VVLGVNLEGQKESAGAVGGTDGRREVLAAGADRVAEPGVKEIFIACVDGRKGFRPAHRCLYVRFKKHLTMSPARLEVRMDSLLPFL
jgi:transposase-like protein